MSPTGKGFWYADCEDVDSSLDRFCVNARSALEQGLRLRFLEYLCDVCGYSTRPVVDFVGKLVGQRSGLRGKLILPDSLKEGSISSVRFEW